MMTIDSSNSRNLNPVGLGYQSGYELKKNLEEASPYIETFRKELIDYCNELLKASGILRNSDKKSIENEIKKLKSEISSIPDFLIYGAIFIPPSFIPDITRWFAHSHGFSRSKRLKYERYMKQSLVTLFHKIRKRILVIEGKISSYFPKTSGTQFKGIVTQTAPMNRMDKIIQKTQEDYKMTPKEKLGRIQSRVENLLAGSKDKNIPITEKVRQELDSIRTRLNFLGEKDATLLNEITAVQRSIEEILTNFDTQEKDQKDNTPVVAITDENQEIAFEILPQNQYAIQDINEKMNFSYKLSSTIKNGSDTVGDGSFIKNVLNPFLALLKNQILGKNLIDANHTSLSQIAKLCETVVIDSNHFRMAFLSELKERKEEGELLDILVNGLIGAIENLSGSNFYREGKNPLQNVLRALKQIQLRKGNYDKSNYTQSASQL